MGVTTGLVISAVIGLGALLVTLAVRDSARTLTRDSEGAPEPIDLCG